MTFFHHWLKQLALFLKKFTMQKFVTEKIPAVRGMLVFLRQNSKNFSNYMSSANKNSKAI